MVVLWSFRVTQGAPRPLWLAVVTSLGASVFAAVAFHAARRGHSMLGREKPVIVSAVIGVPLLLVTWKVVVIACAPGPADAWVGRTGLRCMVVGLLSGAGPFFAFLWIRRRSVFEWVRWTGASIGVAAGAIAWTLNEVRCHPAGVFQAVYLPHVLLGHLLPMLVFVGLGVVLARWLSPGWPVAKIDR